MILTGEPDWSLLPPSTPGAVLELVRGCLHKEREKRFASIDEALAELDLERSTEVPAQVVSPSVAALPFLTLGDDADAEVFAEGMTEDIIAQLAKVGGLTVIARGSVMGFKEREQSLREIGERLRVSTLLDGSIRRAGDRVRIVVQLVEAGSERPLWSETYDRRLDDIFAVQSDVALRVASALSAELSPEVQQRIEKRPTDNMGAYRLYIEGRHCLLRTTGEGIGKGLELFGQAIRLDPGYALAHAGMALAYVWIGFGYAPGLLDSREANARAEDAARSALRLDPDLGYARSMLGLVRMVAHYDWEVAEREMRQALELGPGVPESLGALGLLLSAQGRHEEAIDVTRRALELDPLASVLSSDLATKYLRAGRFEDAIEQARRLLALEPEFPMAHSTLGWAYLKTDRTEEGIRELARAVEAAPGNTMLLAQLGQAKAEAGRAEDARAILDQLSAMAAEQYVSPYHLAYVYTGLGEHDRAVECLDRAYSESASGLYGVNGSFLFEPLHDHPGFRSLLRRMHLAGPPVGP
jgi:TolB-like protein/tetratricopeptide (TPR) repeat protein